MLLSITGGSDLSLFEVNEAARAIQEAAHPDANIIFGAMLDEKLEDEVWITVVATGYGEKRPPREEPARSASRSASRACAATPAAARAASATSTSRNSSPLLRSRGWRTGVVAAGHPLTAAAGAEILRAGGNAVDAALAAMLDVVRRRAAADRARRRRLHARGRRRAASRCCSTSSSRRPGAAPTRSGGRRWSPCDVSFGDVVQVFHIGASSCGAYGTPAGSARPPSRFGTVPLAELARRRWRSRATACSSTTEQAYLFEILAPIYSSTRRRRASCSCPRGACRARATCCATRRSADALERLGAEGAAPFYEGDLGARDLRLRVRAGGTLTREDLAAYRAEPREPVHVRYRGRDVLTNPPPNAGGTLLAYALALLERAPRTAGRAGAGARDGARAGRAHAGVPHRPRRARVPRALHGGPARLDHAHLGARRRRLGVLGDVHERRGLGHRRARHRHPRQQHAWASRTCRRSASSRTRRGGGCRR